MVGEEARTVSDVRLTTRLTQRACDRHRHPLLVLPRLQLFVGCHEVGHLVGGGKLMGEGAATGGLHRLDVLHPVIEKLLRSQEGHMVERDRGSRESARRVSGG